MDSSTALKKLQKAELDIVLMLNEFCAKHSICWALDSGSALGAARHGGFIPWDDDIDISMPRDHYEKFSALAGEYLPDGYVFKRFDNSDAIAGFFGKVYKQGTKFETAETRSAGCEQGIFVDIIPFDAISNDPKEQKRQLLNAAKWQKLSYLYHSSTINVPHGGALGSFEKFGALLAHGLIKTVISDRAQLERNFNKSILKSSPCAGDLLTNMTYYPNGLVPYERMYPARFVKFEGVDLPAPRDLDAYLTIMYGDWHKIPAPKDRHTHLPLLLDFGDGEVWMAEE